MNARLLLVVGGLLMASPVMAESFVNLSSKYCLDTDGRAVNGGVVRMWKCVNHPNQGWTVDGTGSSLYQVKNRSSNFCLDTDGSRMNGAQVRMWGCVDHPNQLWEIHNLPSGSSRLKNKASGFCLDTDGKAENGALVRMWECITHPNQSWKKVADDNAAVAIQTYGISADCTAGNLPAGSYRQSCTKCAASDGNLTAWCKKINNQDNDSTLYSYQSCRSGIENKDGYLTCNKGDSALPSGTYKDSCRDLNVEKNTLYAKCRNVNGDWKEASLPLGFCNYEIYNTDGVLACTLPYGTYQRSCRNARVVNGQLYAECKTRSGAWASTEAPAACNRDLANDDGVLKCL